MPALVAFKKRGAGKAPLCLGVSNICIFALVVSVFCWRGAGRCSTPVLPRLQILQGHTRVGLIACQDREEGKEGGIGMPTMPTSAMIKALQMDPASKPRSRHVSLGVLCGFGSRCRGKPWLRLRHM